MLGLLPPGQTLQTPVSNRFSNLFVSFLRLIPFIFELAMFYSETESRPSHGRGDANLTIHRRR